MFWRDEAGVQGFRGGVVTCVELARQGDLSGCVRTRDGGGLRQPRVSTGEPGVLHDTGGACGADRLELLGLGPSDRSVHLGHVCAGTARTNRSRVQSVDRRVQVCDSGRHRVGVGVEVEERCHGAVSIERLLELKGIFEVWTTKGCL